MSDIYQFRTDPPPQGNYDIRNSDKNKKSYPLPPLRNCDIILQKKFFVKDEFQLKLNKICTIQRKLRPYCTQFGQKQGKY